LHEKQSRLNLGDVHKQHSHAISDVLLKRARYRMLKKPPIMVGLDADSLELSLGHVVRLLGGDLPAVVFSDEPTAKMHDSLLMVLFRLESLIKLPDAQEPACVTYFFPWVLLKEAVLHMHVDSGEGRIIFDRKSLTNAANSIVGIVDEIKHTKTDRMIATLVRTTETASLCLCLTRAVITPLIFAEAVIEIAGFPA
jgi:hypothetical protein